jgi:hypothetical protein
MESLEKQLTEITYRIIELHSFMAPYISSSIIQDKLSKAESQAKPSNSQDRAEQFAQFRIWLNNLYEIIETIFFIIAEKEGASEQLPDVQYLWSLEPAKILSDLDIVAYNIYRFAEQNPELQTKNEKTIRSLPSSEKLCEALSIELNVFQELNPEFLYPTEDYRTKEELPKDAKITTIFVKNTQSLVTNINPLVNPEYVKEHYSDLTTTSGVCKSMVDRFSILKKYPLMGEKETPLLDIHDSNIYQQLDENLYRKLEHYPKHDFARNIEAIPLNTMMTNFENKRITMLRQKERKNKTFSRFDDTIPGKIKNNVLNKGMRVGDGIFNSIYSDTMTDEEVLKLGISSWVYQESIPKDKRELTNRFDNLFRRKMLMKMLP